jgi:hypothetical protein
VTAALENLEHRVVSSTTTDTETTVLVLHVDPSLYRDLNELSKQVTGACMEIMQQVVAQEGDVNLDQEIERKKQQLARKKQQDQQHETTEGSNNGKAVPDHSNDDSDESDEDAPLVQKLAAVRLQVEEEELEQGDQFDAGENDSSDDDFAQNTRRQNQKKNQKKSKKAKRREKEESAERQVRIDAEKQRQEDRFDSQPTSSNSASVANAEQQDQQSTGVASTAKSCNTCGGSFANAAEYRAHFRSDWHRFNQKLKLKSIPPVSEQEFLICDAETFFG